MPSFPNRLHKKLEERAKANALRKLGSTKGLVDFSSNDYLCFSRERDIAHKALEQLENSDHQNGATGSRLLTGNHPLHRSLEKYLSGYFGMEEALLYNSGYDANLGFFSSVPQRGDIIFYDELVHASIRDGIKLGNATAYKFGHNDMQSLEAQLERCRKQNTTGTFYVVTESVFSMDGDSPNLEKLVSFCEKKELLLVVDEAHAIGVFGKGLICSLALAQGIFALIVTFGKAMGCHGAAVLGSGKLISYLINFSRSLIYTTALAPHSVGLIQAAFLHLESKKGQQAIKDLSELIRYFKKQVVALQLEEVFLTNGSAIQIALARSSSKAKELSEKLWKAGFDVRPILSPTVPIGNERLRICLHAHNTEEELDTLLRTMKTIYG